MSRLAIYNEHSSAPTETYTDHVAIAGQLGRLGVRFERWEATTALAANATQEEVIAAYRDSVDRLSSEYGIKSVDVVSLRPDHPQKEELRQKFLDEHVHSDFEVRFFVDGEGVFYLHVDDRVYVVLCEQGDLISVPAGVAHWFDMGKNPNFKCIRLFTIPDGWVAEPTNSGIASSFPDYDNFVAMQA